MMNRVSGKILTYIKGQPTIDCSELKLLKKYLVVLGSILSLCFSQPFEILNVEGCWSLSSASVGAGSFAAYVVKCEGVAPSTPSYYGSSCRHGVRALLDHFTSIQSDCIEGTLEIAGELLPRWPFLNKTHSGRSCCSMRRSCEMNWGSHRRPRPPSSLLLLFTC